MGKIKNVTVRLNVAGQYYITVLVESENQTLPKTSILELVDCQWVKLRMSLFV
ncbi:hypothetical protein [Limosilactobacillus reuteri]|uniref:hypothetical protein n=1 Tax=Limosilactobacillus reuteri TaxID=1598 RepID=UPI001E502D97|nr:hypothetical protein [Limosilactobacillus reuteri]